MRKLLLDSIERSCQGARLRVALFTHLGQVLKAAAHQWVWAAIRRHLNGVLDQPEQLYRQLVDVQDIAEDHLHILQQTAPHKAVKDHRQK